jgi:hypothetical protein|tara:strand:- start:3356 stop:3856 length:501 start_codon:yes stop_codon:yes gene_type:complete
MGFTQRERALGHQKGGLITVAVGPPGVGEGSDGDMTLRTIAKGLVLYIKKDNRWHDVNKLGLAPLITIPTLGAAAATPNVSGSNIFNSGTSTLTINGFNGGSIGQTITVISKAAITYDFDADNLQCGSADIVTASGDATTWIFDGSNWYLISWLDEGEDLSGTGGF